MISQCWPETAEAGFGFSLPAAAAGERGKLKLSSRSVHGQQDAGRE